MYRVSFLCLLLNRFLSLCRFQGVMQLSDPLQHWSSGKLISTFHNFKFHQPQSSGIIPYTAQDCLSGLASADTATSATSATYSASLTVLATDLHAFAIPSSSCCLSQILLDSGSLSSPPALPTPCFPLNLAPPPILRCSRR